MIDFQIDERGDLVPERSKRKSSFEIEWIESEQEGLVIDFFVLSEKEDTADTGLHIDFYLSNQSDLTSHAKVIKSVEAKVQKIRLALSTELGDVRRRPRMGTLLYLQKHEDIHSESNLQKIKNIIQQEIKNELVEPSVVVKPEKGTGNLYFHNVSVRIYEKGSLVFKFLL